MRVDRNLRLALLLLVLIGSFILSLGEESFLFLFISVVACAAHWFGMEEWGGMSEDTARMLVGVAAIVSLLERLLFQHYVIICTAHFLALSQLILLWTKPDNRRIALIILITLAHAAVGTVRTVELGYGFCIVLLTAVVSWALILFLFHREALDADQGDAPPRGMFRPSLRIGAAVFGLGIGLFFILPRTQANMFRQNIAPRTQAISGFSERVALGELGRIKMSAQKVMDVKLTTKDGQPTQAKELPLYWRGTALDTYRFEGGRWSWTRSRRGRYPWYRRTVNPMLGFARGGGELTQTINLEPINTRVLFFLCPLKSLRFQGWARDVIFYRPVPAMMETKMPRTKMIKYVVVSDVLPTPPKQRLEERDRYPTQIERSVMRALTTVPPEVDQRVERLARNITRSAASPRAKAGLIQEYLRDTGGYEYTIDMYSTPGGEPISDFLLNQKRGHCEYFASAMVIMLRTLGIPARMVNGFHGGEWNEFGRFYVVRQSHAHSWVEAYFEGAGWETFDPTPTVDEMLAFSTRIASVARRLMDFFDVTWVNLFIAYSRDDQKEFFGVPAQNVLKSNGFKRLEGFVDGLLAPIANFLAQGPEESEEEEEDSEPSGIVRISKVFAVLLLTILAIAVIVYVGFTVMRFLFGKRLKLDTPGLLYDRFLATVRKRGFRRKPGQTPWEFAGEISVAAPEWAEDVREITLQFCRARYGRRQLSPEKVGNLRECIGRLTVPSRQAAAFGRFR